MDGQIIHPVSRFSKAAAISNPTSEPVVIIFHHEPDNIQGLLSSVFLIMSF